jgi:hypothetical protein
MSQSSDQQPREIVMSTNTNRIAELNDRFRRATGNSDPAGMSLGRKLMTSGIRDLGLLAMVEIGEKVMAFASFNADNDPYGEHDFGSFEHDGHKIFWKIDYYDRASFGTGHDVGSEDPSDPAKTLRILTIMLASEY